MSQAIFALAGALVGVLGTVLTELIRSRREELRFRREALRITCADFISAITKVRVMAFDVQRHELDDDLKARIRELHGDARIHYERLRLLTESRRAQEAARYALRHAWSLILRSEGRPPRPEEGDRGALALLYDSLSILLAETRRELGVARPDDVFAEPEEWLVFPDQHPPSSAKP
jgi:hypothetical protein